MFYVETDNVVNIVGLKNVTTGAYVNTATVTGILYELPAIHPSGVAGDEGSGKVSIPCAGHDLIDGGTVRLERFINYSGVYILQTGTTGSGELIITATYVAETFTGEEFIYNAIEGGVDTEIEFAYTADSDGDYTGKIPYDTPMIPDAHYMLCIKELSGAEQVLAKIIAIAGYQGL